MSMAASKPKKGDTVERIEDGKRWEVAQATGYLIWLDTHGDFRLGPDVFASGRYRVIEGDE